jgi:branched-chain amino acid transport system ATP-binding protein
MLMDEPSLGLAPLIVKDIFDTIRKINIDGVTVLLVEQNSKAALNVAHRGYVMVTGEVVLSDDAKELIRNEDVRKHYLGEG